MTARSEAHDQVIKGGGTKRQAVGAMVNGNKWATENAKAVGNL